MKKKIRIIFICLVIVLLSICCMGSRCQGRQTAPIEYGDFYYSIMTDEETGEQYVRLQGLTEQGQQKKYVIVPSEIDGINVRELNYQGGAWYFEGALISDNLEKIYIPTDVIVMSISFMHCPMLNKVVMLDKKGLEMYDDREGIQVFIISDEYSLDDYGITNFYKYIFPVNVYFANVSFMYNYDEAENNGYYWIDDLDYGTKIEYIPENPEREGYAFDGWYKEPECENIWNFETDTLPEQVLTGDGKEIYQETRLYAKWI